MKSFFFALATVLLFAGTARAQQNFNIGVKAGWNIYEIATDNTLDYNTKSGLQAGLDSKSIVEHELQQNRHI